MDNKKLASDYFKRHKMSNECYITADHRIFHSRGAAESVITHLEDKEIQIFSRETIDNPIEEHTPKIKQQNQHTTKDLTSISKPNTKTKKQKHTPKH